MPHAIWKGNISFGLVNIPVGLYSAEKGEAKLDFTLLDKRDLSPVGYRRYNKKSGKEVEAADIVKGYEFDEERYVVLSDADFRKANAKATQTIEILDFVEASDIHPVFFEKPYFLAPIGRGGQKSYALLRETLKRSGKAGVARVVIHTREYVGLVLPYGKGLILNILRYAEELRGPDEFNLPEENLEALGITEKELGMAERLVEGMYSEWSPDKYHDTYSDELKQYIKQKIEAGETEKVEEVSAQAAPEGKVIDLMALLKKSLEEKTVPARPKKKAAQE